jgi:Dolichyl-phosphate-mannose-protein mannosyltransferase
MASLNAAAIAMENEQARDWRLRLLFPVTLCVIALLLLLQVSTVLMWFDEMATYEPAHLPNAAQTLAFFTQGFDTPSPIPAFLLRGSMQVIGDTDVKDRLIFMAFFLGMCGFVYAFAQRRYPTGYALAAMLFLAGTPVREFALTMRAYVLLLFGAAAMMYFWQAAVSGERRVLNLAGLWISFAFAALSHLFAIFLFVPFAIAELVRTGASPRRADKGVWCVLLTAPFSLVLLLPAMLAARARYAHGFWSRPTLANLGQAYAVPLKAQGFGLILLTVIVAVVIGKLWPGNSNRQTGERRGFTRAEWALVLGVVCLPLVGVAGALPLGAFQPKYVLPVILGIDLALMGLAARLGAFRPRAGYVIAGLFLIYAVAAQHRSLSLIRNGHFGSRLIREAQTQPWMTDICASGLPVLGATPHDYFMYQHYAPPCMQSKLFYATDEEKARSVPDLFTDEENMIWFSKFLPLKVVPYASFLAAHRDFLVFSSHTVGHADADWLLPELEGGKDSLHVTAMKHYDSDAFGPETVYTVRQGKWGQ